MRPPPDAAPFPGWLAPAGGRRIAVLGADGFIGSQVVRAALAAGADVLAVAVKEPWRLSGVGGARVVRVADGRWWDPSFRPALRRELADVDALALLAYTPPPSGLDSAAALERELSVNAAGAERAAAVAADCGARTVFASSADVYGPWHDDPVDEDAPPAPARPYAVGKLAAERLVDGAADGAATALRLSTVFGPGEDGPRAVPNFIRAFAGAKPAVVHGDGTDVRDYVWLGDVAAAFVNACVRDCPDVVNIGSGVGRTTLDMVSLVAHAVGVEPRVERVPATRAPSRLVLAVERARAAIHFEPASDLESGIVAEAAWLLGRSSGPATPRAG